MIREQNARSVIWPYSVALKEQYSKAILVVVDKADINPRDEPIIGQSLAASLHVYVQVLCKIVQSMVSATKSYLTNRNYPIKALFEKKCQRKLQSFVEIGRKNGSDW